MATDVQEAYIRLVLVLTPCSSCLRTLSTLNSNQPDLPTKPLHKPTIKMLFKSLAVVSVLAATVAADGAAIAASLNACDKQAVKLGSSTQAFDGNIFLGIPVLSDTIDLQNLIKSGTTTAQNSSALSDSEAINLVAPVQQLAADTNKTVTILINKYPDFKKSSLDGIVKSNLQDTKKYSDAYSAAIIAKVPASLQDTARSIAAPIDASFAQAIQVYSQGSLF